MHQEVTKTVECYSKSNIKSEVVGIDSAEKNAQKTWDRKNQKEHVIFFKETRLVLMVVFVEIPHQSMHDVFMRKPGHEFHEEECANYQEYVHEYAHFYKFNKPIRPLRIYLIILST